MNTDTSKEAIRAIQKRICSTPFPDGFQSIADDASAMIDALAAKLAEVTAERDRLDGNRQALEAHVADLSDQLAEVRSERDEWKSAAGKALGGGLDAQLRSQTAEAMLPRAYRAGVEAASREAAYSGAIQHKADGSYAGSEPVLGPDVADAIRALPTPTIEQLKEMMKD